jgi:hypothetical protein
VHSATAGRLERSGEFQEDVVKSFSKGDRVTRPEYGAGTVTDVNALHTVIDFDDHGLRRFVTNLVVLERTLEPAPVRAKAARRVKRVAGPAAKATAADTGRAAEK